MMRFVFLSLLTLISFGFAIGQDEKWDYGIQLHYNGGLIKPVAADTFNNKAGFGAGLFYERKFKRFGLQFAPNFVQTRYEHDTRNTTAITNSADIGLNALVPFDKTRQAHAIVGFISSFTFLHSERFLTGGELDRPVNQAIVNYPFDLGFRLGIGLDMSPGNRLSVSYYDFLRGGQSSRFITGKIDYIQVGWQLRINEQQSNQDAIKKNEAQKASKNKAIRMANNVKAGNDGHMIFVLRTQEGSYFQLFKPLDDEKEAELKEEYMQNMISAIQQKYDHGSFVITTDTAYENWNGDFNSDLEILKSTSETEYVSINLENSLVARIDQLFLDASSGPKWGVFVFDLEGNPMKEPFPFYTPYFELDTDFSSISGMISNFNSHIGQVARMRL